MTFTVRYLATARQQVRRATAHYAAIRPELADRFNAELDAVVQDISVHPQQYQMLNARYHRAFLDRFPFVVAYRLDGTAVVIVGVVPMKTDPSKLQTITRP